MKTREQRHFWYHDEGFIGETQGYACNEEGMWWCPTWGYSAREGGSLFDTKEQAKEKAVSWIHEEISRLHNRLAKLND